MPHANVPLYSIGVLATLQAFFAISGLYIGAAFDKNYSGSECSGKFLVGR
jgi:hypothetical protein